MSNKNEFYDIPGYEGFYKISLNGDVISVTRAVNTCYGKTMVRKAKPMSSCLMEGYPSVHVSKNGKKGVIKIHRALAMIFIPNPENKPQINHIDSDRANFSLSNLEWVTASENTMHAYKKGRMNTPSPAGDNHHCARVVLDLQTGIFYGTAKEAAEVKGIRHGTLISILNGSRKNKTSLIYA